MACEGKDFIKCIEPVRSSQPFLRVKRMFEIIT